MAKPDPRPRGNAVTVEEVAAALPIALACSALIEARLIDYYDEDIEMATALAAPPELLAPLP